MRSRLPLARTVLLLTGAFVAAIVLVLAFVELERVVVADGAFTGPSRPVRAPRDGVIVELLVESGTRVEAGAVLARLDARSFEAERAELAAKRSSVEARRAEFEREKKHLAETVQPAEREALARAESAAELVVEAAKVKEKRFSDLQAVGLVEQGELEDAALARKLAEVELETARTARAQRPALETSALAEVDARVAEVGFELAAFDAQSVDLERRAAERDLVAPVAGCVLAPPRSEFVGRAVRAGDETMRVAVAGVEAFLAHVDDRGRARVKNGLAAKLRLDGYPWLVHGTVDAKVTLIADRADEHGYLVRLEIDPALAPGPLFEGMRGRARIATAESASLLRLGLEELFGLESK
ncbi:MAG: HlyD family secretion protein [Planctomycetes bacterium]|nr:HlyD family secretion protein [Planctomycetota bacterium]